MKKIFLSVLIFLAIFAATPISRAEGAAKKDYFAKIQTTNVLFYALPNEESALFQLPYSYFVKVVGVEGNFYEATFKDKSGYVKKSDVALMSGTPTNAYPSAQFMLFEPHYLYTSPSKAEVLTAVSDDVTLNYYGDMQGEELKYENTLWAYCSLQTENGVQFGYVYSTFIDRLPKIETNLEIFDTIDESVFTSSATNFSGLSVGTQILLIVAISVPSIMILFFLIKPSKIIQSQKGKKKVKKQKTRVSHGDYFEFDENEL